MMCRQKKKKEPLSGLRKRIQTLRLCTRGRIIQKLSGGMSQDQLLEILQSLGRQLQTPPHYPVRLVRELADKLGISYSQARRLKDFLEKEDLIRYSCSFEAENEDQNKTVLEINSTRDFSPVFA